MLYHACHSKNKNYSNPKQEDTGFQKQQQLYQHWQSAIVEKKNIDNQYQLSIYSYICDWYTHKMIF